MPSIELMSSVALCPTASHLTFRAPYRHEAGQYVRLEAARGSKPEAGYYSIASPPRPDGSVEFCIRHVGGLAAHLCQLAAGRTVESSPPSGNMRLADAARRAVYVAAGTGIAPMRAMLLAQLERNTAADATLVLGARHSQDLLFHREFRELATRHPGLRLLPTVSGDDPGWSGLRGRVTAHIGRALAGRKDLDTYFCGPPEMVRDLRGLLAARGVPDSRQCYERY